MLKSFLKTNLITILLFSLSIESIYIFIDIYTKAEQKNTIKSLKIEIESQKSLFKLCKKNSEIDAVNTEISGDVNRTKKEIKELKQKDLNETFSHGNNNANIFGGMYFKTPN